MLVDHAVIWVCAGRGGDGCVSFRRAKYVPKGGPDGGDGGDGGSVQLVATAGVDTLLDFSGRHHWRAENGKPGSSCQRTGGKGSDLRIRIPPGTLVYDDETGEMLGDLDVPGKQLQVARGGKGGYGNEHFKSATHQVPREFTPGGPGQERRLRFDLKLIADVGLVGKPNAGKSTLLSRISAARPKIGDYPFTTLEAHLGIVDLGKHRRMVVADIPGLIEGASGGTGLGVRFLRHVERTRCLVHVLEVDCEEIEPSAIAQRAADDYRVVRRELAEYSSVLTEKPHIVVLNKVELLPGDEVAEVLDRLEQHLGERPMPISGVSGQGLGDLLQRCRRLLGQVGSRR